MPTLLAAVDSSQPSRIMFRWLLENELQPTDKLHLLHVAMRVGQDREGLPHTDYFDQVGAGWSVLTQGGALYVL